MFTDILLVLFLFFTSSGYGERDYKTFVDFERQEGRKVGFDFGEDNSDSMHEDASFVGILKQLFFSSNKSSTVKPSDMKVTSPVMKTTTDKKEITTNSFMAIKLKDESQLKEGSEASSSSALSSDNPTTEGGNISSNTQRSMTTCYKAKSTAKGGQKNCSLSELTSESNESATEQKAVETNTPGEASAYMDCFGNNCTVKFNEDSTEIFSTMNLIDNLFHGDDNRLVEEIDEEDIPQSFRATTMGTKRRNFALNNRFNPPKRLGYNKKDIAFYSKKRPVTCIPCKGMKQIKSSEIEKTIYRRKKNIWGDGVQRPAWHNPWHRCTCVCCEDLLSGADNSQKEYNKNRG